MKNNSKEKERAEFSEHPCENEWKAIKSCAFPARFHQLCDPKYWTHECTGKGNTSLISFSIAAYHKLVKVA